VHVHIGAPEILLRDVSAERALNDGRTGREQLGALDHARPVREQRICGDAAGDRAHDAAEHRHLAQQQEWVGPVLAVRDVRAAQTLHRPDARTRAVQELDHRDAILLRHREGHVPLVASDRSAAGTTPDREVLTGDNDVAAADSCQPGDVGRRDERVHRLALVVGRGSDQLPDLEERSGIDQAVEALTNGQPAHLVLPRDPLGAAHRECEVAATADLFDLIAPCHVGLRNDTSASSASTRPA
jgi:hypothetical protein